MPITAHNIAPELKHITLSRQTYANIFRSQYHSPAMMQIKQVIADYNKEHSTRVREMYLAVLHCMISSKLQFEREGDEFFDLSGSKQHEFPRDLLIYILDQDPGVIDAFYTSGSSHLEDVRTIVMEAAFSMNILAVEFLSSRRANVQLPLANLTLPQATVGADHAEDIALPCICAPKKIKALGDHENVYFFESSIVWEILSNYSFRRGRKPCNEQLLEMLGYLMQNYSPDAIAQFSSNMNDFFRASSKSQIDDIKGLQEQALREYVDPQEGMFMLFGLAKGLDFTDVFEKNMKEDFVLVKSKLEKIKSQNALPALVQQQRKHAEWIVAGLSAYGQELISLSDLESSLESLYDNGRICQAVERQTVIESCEAFLAEQHSDKFLDEHEIRLDEMRLAIAQVKEYQPEAAVSGSSLRLGRG